jgi:hypothetical protein
LRCNDGVKGYGEVSRRRREQVVVDVGDDGEAVALPECAERRNGIVERPPVGKRLLEAAGLRRIGGKSQLRGEALHDAAQDDAVGLVGARLLGRLARGIALEESLIAYVHPPSGEHGPERGEDPGFPVNECTVAVERDRAYRRTIDHSHSGAGTVRSF